MAIADQPIGRLALRFRPLDLLLARPSRGPVRLARVVLFVVPVVWIASVNIAPLLEMIRISFLDAYPATAGRPPSFSTAPYSAFFTSPLYRHAFARTMEFAALTTLMSLLVVYPLAYYVARHVPPSRRMRRLLILMAPFWTSEVIRTFAIIILFGNRGGLNTLLQYLGLTDAPIPMLYTNFSLAFGMLYAVLLSMLLPLFVALDAIPTSLLEAATDLGAGPWTRFLRVTMPLSRNGIASGCVLVFLLSTGAFVVPVLLGGANTTLLAVSIGDFFGSISDKWPYGAAFSMVLLVSSLAIAGLMMRVIQPSRTDAG